MRCIKEAHLVRIGSLSPSNSSTEAAVVTEGADEEGAAGLVLPSLLSP